MQNPQRVTIYVSINGYKAYIYSIMNIVGVTVMDKNSTCIYSFVNTEFRHPNTKFTMHEYSLSNVQYYNVSEEQAFQYNTIMDFSTLQAMVHLYEAITGNERTTVQEVLDSINNCIAQNLGAYSITNIRTKYE